ncbi:UPF0280 family protein [Candidatus Bathyarchaeota archaeon]|nr:UPF0280 family protein [Candidatus Bathyarchaeota archaeon]
MQKQLYEQGFLIRKSKIHLKSDSEKAIFEAIKDIKNYLKEIMSYIKIHPEFQHTLRPINVLPDAPELIRYMANSALKAGVGPMASVAGAIADFGMKAMLRSNAKTAVVEDGGEIAVTTDQPVIVGLLSSYPGLSGKIGFYIAKEDSPLGIATSSSKTGRVLSFGEADSVTIVADNASLADAAATAVCNVVAGTDICKSIRRGLDRAKEISGVHGVIIIREGQIGLWGRLPRIINVKG